ncbi:MAG: RluA family pseudouridine synthase [bacterium]
MKKKENASSTNKLTIKPEFSGARLDKFLTENLGTLSRSKIKAMILDEEVLVNGKVSSVHRFLKTDDIITFQEKKIAPKVVPIKTKKTKKTNWEIEIVAEEPDYLIVEKPAGILVHPTVKNIDNTLIDLLIAKYPELKKIGESPERAAIVHRLDKDVSGLMVIPRTQASFDYFKNLFKTRGIVKKYEALVYGEVEKDSDTIDMPIGRSLTKPGLFAAHPYVQGNQLSAKDKPAITTYEVKERFINHTLLDIQILTGRTHQIRVHLLSKNIPIVGDPLYINNKLKLNKPISRIFLHSYYLAFTDPAGNQREYKSKLPLTLRQYLKEMKK